MLPDVLADDLTVVFCGTAVGKKSAQVSAYYAGPGNKFWRVLHTIELTPCVLRPEEYRSLLQYDIGLTDLVKSKSGSDADLSAGDFDVTEFERKILHYSPHALCFNGKRAAQEFLRTRHIEYGPISQRIGRTRLFVAPSTSGAANGYWDESVWRRLAVESKRL